MLSLMQHKNLLQKKLIIINTKKEFQAWSFALLFRYTLIRSCCEWSPQHRLSVPGLIETLQAGERSANGSTVLRVAEPLDIAKYMREAGYGEAYNYAVL